MSSLSEFERQDEDRRADDFFRRLRQAQISGRRSGDQEGNGRATCCQRKAPAWLARYFGDWRIGRGRSRRSLFRTVGLLPGAILPGEAWNVGALWDGNADRIMAPLIGVVAVDIMAQPSRLEADDRVRLGIEGLVSSVDRHRNSEPLDPVGAALKRLLDDETQQGGAPRGSAGRRRTRRCAPAAPECPRGPVQGGLALSPVLSLVSKCLRL